MIALRFSAAVLTGLTILSLSAVSLRGQDLLLRALRCEHAIWHCGHEPGVGFAGRRAHP